MNIQNQVTLKYKSQKVICELCYKKLLYIKLSLTKKSPRGYARNLEKNHDIVCLKSGGQKADGASVSPVAGSSETKGVLYRGRG